MLISTCGPQNRVNQHCRNCFSENYWQRTR